MKSPTEIISRMESMQSRFRRLQLEDQKECKVPWCGRKATKTERCDIHAEVHAAYKDNRTDEQKAIGAYYDRVMSERGDNGELDQLSEDYAIKELGEGWRQ